MAGSTLWRDHPCPSYHSISLSGLALKIRKVCLVLAARLVLDRGASCRSPKQKLLSDFTDLCLTRNVIPELLKRDGRRGKAGTQVINNSSEGDDEDQEADPCFITDSISVKTHLTRSHRG